MKTEILFYILQGSPILTALSILSTLRKSTDSSRFIVSSINCENAIQLWWSFQNPCFCLLLPGSELSLLASSWVCATSLPSQMKTTHWLISVLDLIVRKLWRRLCSLYQSDRVNNKHLFASSGFNYLLYNQHYNGWWSTSQSSLP